MCCMVLCIQLLYLLCVMGEYSKIEGGFLLSWLFDNIGYLLIGHDIQVGWLLLWLLIVTYGIVYTGCMVIVMEIV